MSNVSAVQFFQTPSKHEAWWRWRIKGIIANNSKSALASISFLLTLKDCPSNQQCKIIGKKTVATRNGDYVLVPAGQVGLFQTEEMQFKNMPASSNLQWGYKITEIRAVAQR